jgi:soluble lytic murein transglycosylase-like protein
LFFSTARAESIPYLATFYKAEIENQLPPNLLVEVARQESSFRKDVISCKVKSSKGAEGIMQIIPQQHPGINPCRPKEAIMYAGRYLRSLYNSTHSWPKALAAYNWGLSKVKRNKQLPQQVRDYVDSIITRVLDYKIIYGVLEK